MEPWPKNWRTISEQSFTAIWIRKKMLSS